MTESARRKKNLCEGAIMVYEYSSGMLCVSFCCEALLEWL